MKTLRQAFSGLLGAGLGLLLAFAVCVGFARLSDAVPRAPILAQLLPAAELRERLIGPDRFTACITISIAGLETAAPLLAIAQPAWLHPVDPCPKLERFLSGALDPEDTAQPFRHWAGVAFVLRPLLAVLPLEIISGLYVLLTLLTWWLLWRAARAAHPALGTCFALLAVLALLPGGGLVYAVNIAHAPGFFLPLLALAALLHFRARLTGVFGWAMALAALGFITIFFDMLFGAFQLVLVLAWLSVYFLALSARPSIAQVVTAGLGTGLAFFIGLGGGIALKLALTALAQGDAAAFLHYAAGLTQRMGNVAQDQAVTLPALLLRLWQNSANFTGHEIVTLLYWLAGLGAWIRVALDLPRRPQGAPLLLALMGGAGLVLGWLLAFPNHSFIHGFMSRLLFLPPALGFFLLWQWLEARRLPG